MHQIILIKLQGVLIEHRNKEKGLKKKPLSLFDMKML